MSNGSSKLTVRPNKQDSASSETAGVQHAKSIPDTSLKQPMRTTVFPDGKWDALIAVGYATFMFWLIVYNLGPGIVYILLHAFAGADGARALLERHEIFWQFILVAVTEALTITSVVYFLRRRGAKLNAIGWVRAKLFDPVSALAGYFAYFILHAVLLAVVLHAFPSLNVDQKQQLGFDDVIGNTDLVLTFVSLVVLAPLAEELLFRGLLFTGLKKRFGFALTTLITSILFAALHLQFGSGAPLLWVAAIDIFSLSLVLCYLRYKTDSLVPGIILHALKNGIAFIGLYIIAR